jgi:hypothetical protein
VLSDTLEKDEESFSFQYLSREVQRVFAPATWYHATAEQCVIQELAQRDRYLCTAGAEIPPHITGIKK